MTTSHFLVTLLNGRVAKPGWKNTVSFNTVTTELLKVKRWFWYKKKSAIKIILMFQKNFAKNLINLFYVCIFCEI